MGIIKDGVHVICCSNCNGTEYTVKTKVSGYIYEHFSLDPSIEGDSNHMYDYLTYPNKYSKCYCDNCGKYLGIFDKE